MPEELTAETITSLLREVGQVLAEQGLVGVVHLVGGAAIALSVNPRRVTEDVDNILDSGDAVNAAARTVGERHGLSPHWLNSNAAMFATERKVGSVVLDAAGIRVLVSPPEHLLAMKLAAFRPQDVDDLVRLFELLGIEEPQEAVDIAFEAYGGPDGTYAEMFGPRKDYLLRASAVMDRLSDRRPGARTEQPAPPTGSPTPKCTVCGRPLRSPRSQSEGVGPKCAQRGG